MTFDLRAACRHVQDAVLAAPLGTDPFAHLIIADIYPDDVYEQIMERWPELSLFNHTNSRTRHEFNFRTEGRRLGAEARSFWFEVNKVTNVANITVQQRLAPHFGEKFESYLGQSWRKAVGGNVECLATTIQLATYTKTYRLAPHVDAFRLLTNAFVYFSEKSEPEPDLGTVLYHPRGLAIPTNWAVPESKTRAFLDRRSVSPYQRNHCLAYVNSPISFHGVDEHHIGDRHRRLLMFGSMVFVREINRIFGEEMGRWVMGDQNASANKPNQEIK